MQKLYPFVIAAGMAACLLAASPAVRADAVTDWNTLTGDLLVQSRMGTPPAVRVMAIVQTAVHEALADVQRLPAASGSSVAAQAAIAAAHRVTLSGLLPQRAADVLQAYRTAVDRLGEGAETAAGIAAGERAAERVLAWRADDGATAPDRYRPYTSPGVYVPTGSVAAPHWGRRTPWVMQHGAQFRPAAPPALDSEQWARDYNEVKALGSKLSTARTAAQTDVARFWEFSLPPIYHGVIRSVAFAPGRGLLQNARLFAAASQAMDDAVIAVMDAKYHYGFWRPITAIRNGDTDGHPGTEVDPGWAPLIDNPAHPEYPSAHTILAGAVAGVLKAEQRRGKLPELATSSPSANGAIRRWTSVDAFIGEVADARVWEGLHYRHSTQVGLDMGQRIGALAAARPARLPLDMPQALDRPGTRVLERVHARGVQVYACRPDREAPAGASWALVAPLADLFDDTGERIGVHDGGPHWRAFDGSRVRGQVEARAQAPAANDLPWLLLAARSVGAAGRFSDVTAIQRVKTHGGNAPRTPCDVRSAGVVERVPYAADYLMLGSTREAVASQELEPNPLARVQ